MVRFTRTMPKNESEAVYVNAAHVLYIEPYGKYGSIIHVTDGHEIRVKEPAHTAQERIRKALP